ncbi:hypothetical protein GBJ32_01055 [Bifidobacterium longum]|uniref:Uncharacterized protein n=2 Tax=Bifidobacterium longum TaxID=216816 RepID=A0A2U0BNY2_BIFLN|nr:hypothetical protein DVB78_02675 [Bifidobacterium longum subsp. longum]KAB6723644.1 hypothetical protein GBL36_01135 [Bifidobacterium longum]MBD9131797.1 hypothetical protein [Bifidobacterium bifidum]MRZ82527.1 hypothetical protein [Paeniclostridium sordellii]MSB99165.1 hypothetical protein [Lacticaseibacillus rhamnosus]
MLGLWGFAALRS